jgi:hypothetical protein
MSIIGFRGVSSCMISCVINLGLVGWGLFLIGHGWDLRQSGGGLMREGAATFLAGGLFLFLTALAGIIHAMFSLRTIANDSESPRHARVRSLDTTS